MSFWTWLDRNGGGVFWLVVITLCFAFGQCGDGKGCRLHCEPQLGVHVTHEPSIADGGSHD